jgi:hypothetical protein
MKQRRLHRDPRHRIISGKEYAQRKREYEYTKQRVIFHILLKAAKPDGVTRYHRLDTQLTKYCFDSLILSEPAILKTIYRPELSSAEEERLVIGVPVSKAANEAVSAI